MAKLSRFDCSSVKRFWTNCRSSSVRLVFSQATAERISGLVVLSQTVAVIQAKIK